MEFFDALKKRWDLVRSQSTSWRIWLGGLAAIACFAALTGLVVPGSLVGPVFVVITTLYLVSLFGYHLSTARLRDQLRVDIGAHLLQRVESGKRIAIYDPLTGLYLRWYFELRWAEEVERCRRYKATAAVLVIALAGDEAAGSRRIQLAQRLSHKVRSVDLAGTLSNQEWVLCLPSTSRPGALKTVRRLIGELRDFEVTVGLAMCPADGEIAEDLLSEAQAMARSGAGSSHLESFAAARPRRKYDFIFSGNQEAVRELGLEQDESVTAAKAALQRASRRRGIQLDIWDENGKIYFKAKAA